VRAIVQDDSKFDDVAERNHVEEPINLCDVDDVKGDRQT
jgi:hypothetical protein